MRFVWRLLIVAAIASSVVVTGFSCSKKTTKHEPVKYQLYACAQVRSDPVRIFSIDIEIDSVIDSVDYPGTTVRVAASPDGKYLAAISGKSTWIYDAQDLTFLGELSCRFPPAFDPQARLIVGIGESGMRFFDYETFELLAEDTAFLAEIAPGIPRYLQAVPGLNRIYARIFYRSSILDSTGFVAYDYRKRKIIKLWHRLSRPDGDSYRIVLRYHIHPDGRRVYGTAATQAGWRIFCYDLWADSSIFEHTIHSGYGGVRVSPDGRELYLTDPGYPHFDYTPAKIFIYDAVGGTLLDDISLKDLDTTGPLLRPLYAYDIRFHPHRPKAYVACGYVLKAAGPILVIDTQERRIIKWIFPQMDHLPEWIDVGPKP